MDIKYVNCILLYKTKKKKNKVGSSCKKWHSLVVEYRES